MFPLAFHSIREQLIDKQNFVSKEKADKFVLLMGKQPTKKILTIKKLLAWHILIMYQKTNLHLSFDSGNDAKQPMSNFSPSEDFGLDIDDKCTYQVT